MSDAIDRTAIRRVVRKVIQDGPVDRRETVVETASRLDIPESVVRNEVEELERMGFVYLVGEGDSAEVKLP